MYKSGRTSTVQNRWKENTNMNMACEKSQKDLQMNALIEAIHSAKILHWEGPGYESFVLKIKPETMQRLKQLLGEAELMEILHNRNSFIQQTYDDAIRRSVIFWATREGYPTDLDYCLRDARSLGIDKKWLNEQAKKAIDKRRDEERRREERALAKINETVSLLQSSSEGEHLSQTIILFIFIRIY